MSAEPQNWHSLSGEQAAQQLGVDIENGLSEAESRARLAQYGHNELIERAKMPFWQLLLNQFKEFLVLILIVAAVVSSIVGLNEYNQTGELTEFIDAGAIIAIIILNALLGVVQESKAEEALAALKKMAAPDARVIREGKRSNTPASELAPGDVVLLEAGNHVPADIRLVESVNLKIEESSLTGESVPTEKEASLVIQADTPVGDRHNLAFMNTTVTYGRGRGVVVETGMQTQIGRIAEMLQEYEQEPTPLQIKLDQLGKILGIASLGICGVVFMVGVLRGIEVLDMFMISVSLAIAAVPEGLPAIVTICLALGMREMVKHHALIRRLPAVETLGSASVICSDKTGTLTQNEMMVTRLVCNGAELSISGEGYRPWGFFHDNGQTVDIQNYPRAKMLLQSAMLCNDAILQVSSGEDGEMQHRMVGDPTEGALVVAAARADLWQDDQSKLWPRVAEIPFDSQRKRMSTIHKKPNGTQSLDAPLPGEYVAFVKGAPDVMLELCTHTLDSDGDQIVPLDERARQAISASNSQMASQAIRVLAVAYKPLDALPAQATPQELEKDLVFVGLAGMVDPARPEVAAAIDVARRAGIRTVMITGDYPDTARAIAQEIGLLRPQAGVTTGAKLNTMDDAALLEQVDHIDVFARVSPEHKVRIVEALKARDQVVAMTGDGVNDAPALKQANIGVAMGITGTDVTKETADMVLTDDNYASIVSAIKQGRIIYSNIRKFVFYLLSCNLAEIMIIFIAMLANWPTPLTAIQLLWLNLLTDGAPALALGLEKGDPDIMERKPRPLREPIVNREMQVWMLIQTIAITTAVLLGFLIGRNRGGDGLAQTMAFVTLSASELLRAYTSRSERAALWQIGVFSNKVMQYAVSLSLFMLILVIYVPFLQEIFDTQALGLTEWALMLPLMLLPSVAAEVTKWVMRRSDRQQAAALNQ